MAAAALALAGHGEEIEARFGDEPAARTVAAMLARGVRTPATTSMGRWFDAAAGLLGLTRRMAFEGQAAMLLEGLAERRGSVPSTLPLYSITPDNELDLAPLVPRLCATRDAVFGAALFHATVVTALAAWVERAVRATGIATVACSGGCFLNALVARGLRDKLSAMGIDMLEAQAVPPNDGGLSLGQAWVARHALGRGA
jgi:hydrogenase maturation protein HypF